MSNNILPYLTENIPKIDEVKKIIRDEGMMTLNRIIPKGVNLLHKSVVRFKSTTSAESSFPRNERLSEDWKNIAGILSDRSSQVANYVVIFTGLSGALFIAWEFFSIVEVKTQISEIKAEAKSQNSEVRSQFSEIKAELRSQNSEIKAEIVGMRQDMATQGARIDNLFQTFMDQTIENQKQFAFQSKEIAEASKKDAEASKKADERYYELLNAIKSERK